MNIGDADAVDDALAVLELATNLYHDARRDGVRQAVRAGATVSEIAIALGMAIDDTRDLVRRRNAIASSGRSSTQQARCRRGVVCRSHVLVG